MPRWKCEKKPKNCRDSEWNLPKEELSLLFLLQEVTGHLPWLPQFRQSLPSQPISLLLCNWICKLFLLFNLYLIGNTFFFFRKPNGPSKALKLGGRLKDAEIFVDQLKSEGENVNSFQSPASVVQGGSVSSNKLPPATIATEPYLSISQYPFKFNPWLHVPLSRVQLRIEEKLSLSCGRDGGLHNMEIHGLLTLFITDEAYGRVRVQVNQFPPSC